ncbi:hypothetical protein [Moraxella lacunata]|uniref:hypothetical protein n=1 Tax=Moraxella lacunata TaxID=477 RepID=UPI003EE37951
MPIKIAILKDMCGADSYRLMTNIKFVGCNPNMIVKNEKDKIFYPYISNCKNHPTNHPCVWHNIKKQSHQAMLV